MKNKLSDSESLNVSWAELSAALLEFRDALMEVSLYLIDYQFDHDIGGRKEAENVAQELAGRIAMQVEQSRRQ